jgi:GH15 family glucan-1,4-alpha-glucosidase
MPRDIPVGNGRLLVCFDQNYCIRDLYFPHVGQENHVNGFTTDSGGLAQFAVGQKGSGAQEGTFRDAEDGLLSGNTIAQGSVDSVVSLTLTLEGASKRPAFPMRRTISGKSDAV